MRGTGTTQANPYKTPELVEEACKHKKYLIVKVIRFENVESLHCALRAGVKILYLVRDLRGVIYSRMPQNRLTL